MGCEEVDAVPNNEQPVVQPPTTVVRDVPAGMSREDLYAMLSQQASAREETDVRRTPSPPPRLIEAARTSAPPSGTHANLFLFLSCCAIHREQYYIWEGS